VVAAGLGLVPRTGLGAFWGYPPFGRACSSLLRILPKGLYCKFSCLHMTTSKGWFLIQQERSHFKIGCHPDYLIIWSPCHNEE
jgi:hypothetical protein